MDDRDHDIDALLAASDPWPPSREVDPTIAVRALARAEKEMSMTDQASTPPRRRPGRRGLAVVLAVVVVVAAAALGVTRLGGEGADVAGGSGRALGSPFASCLEFSVETLALAPIAFDGTVSSIDGGRVTFDVERWYRGGDGDTVTVAAQSLIDGAPELEGGVGFVEGRRYLVSADDSTGPIVPAICGFTVEYDEGMADTWARAFVG